MNLCAVTSLFFTASLLFLIRCDWKQKEAVQRLAILEKEQSLPNHALAAFVRLHPSSSPSLYTVSSYTVDTVAHRPGQPPHYVESRAPRRFELQAQQANQAIMAARAAALVVRATPTLVASASSPSSAGPNISPVPAVMQLSLTTWQMAVGNRITPISQSIAAT